MSMTLNLVDRLLDRGRNLHQVGHSKEAARLFDQLAAWRDLPREAAEEAHSRLADIHLENDRLKQARRHLAAAMALAPENARHHYLTAIAIEDDPNCDPRRAERHYRRCLELDGDQAEYHCDYGLYAIANDQLKAGVRALHRAAELAADDPEILRRVADGLREANRPGEALTILRAALFRNPRERRFRDLMSRHRFAILHAAQQPAKSSATNANEKAVILKMPRRPKRVQKVAGKTIRTDGPSALKGPTILPFQVARKPGA